MIRRVMQSRAICAIAGFLIGAAVFGGSAAIAAGIAAQPRTAEVVIDGQPADLMGYLIEGSHYFKLRDISEKLAPGGKDFSIVWDGGNNRVLIDTSKPYTPESSSAPQATAPETPAPVTDIPGGTAVDHSLQANPAIFDWYFTRAKYNTDRQRVLDTGEIVTGWGPFEPSSEAALIAANKFFDGLSQMSDLDTVRKLNDFLCAHMVYRDNSSFSGNDFWLSTAYGVCEDYAQIFRYMCYRAGIPCIYITGVADGNGHAWNEVYIDGEWLFYDGNLSDIRQSIVLGDAAVGRHTYTAGSQQSIMYHKELFVPSSTL